MTAWVARTLLLIGVDDPVDRVSEQEFQAFMTNLQQMLNKFGVPPAEQAELKAIVESIREAIIDRAGAEGPLSSGGGDTGVTWFMGS